VFVTALDRLLSDIDNIQASMEKITNIFYSIISLPYTEEPSDEYFKIKTEIIEIIDIKNNKMTYNLLKNTQSTTIIFVASIFILNQIYKKVLQNIQLQIYICL